MELSALLLTQKIREDFNKILDRGRAISLGAPKLSLQQTDPSGASQRTFQLVPHVSSSPDIFFVPTGTRVTEASGKEWRIPSDGFMCFPDKASYNVFIYSDGPGLNFYANLSKPLQLIPTSPEGRYVDLYLDVRLRSDGSVELLDQDELTEALNNRRIDCSLYDHVVDCGHSLVQAARLRAPPFNLDLLSKLLVTN